MRKRSFRATFRRLATDRGGSAMIIVGFSIIPMMAAVGMSIDYARAAKLQTKLNSIADAAALSAVTTPMMSQSSLEACAAARRMFGNQIQNLDGLVMNTADPQQLQITVTDNASSTNCSANKSATSTAYQRTAKVSYTAISKNTFGGILGLSSVVIGGTSETKAAVAPNIDFYVLLDTSGSMAFPTTSAGITLLKSKTGGCAFACHSTNDKTAKDKNNNNSDYYGVATSYGISLRVDEARKAVQSMMTLATETSQNNKATYRAGLATFAAASTQANNYFKKRADVTTDLQSVATAANAAQTSLYYSNGNPTSTYHNDDTDTATSDAFTKYNAIMTTPGNGTNNAGDKPQAIMFIITDGMRDESRPGSKPEVAIDTAFCDTVKSRGIRIGILYTEYLSTAIDNDDWSVQPAKGNVLNRLPQIEPALQTCSSPGLFYKVTTDDDISAALAQLFRQAVATAHITQ